MESNVKIEKIPHGMVLRDTKNSVYITRRDMKELLSRFKFKDYNMIGETFTTTSTLSGVIFMDLWNAEQVFLNYNEVMELFK